LNDETPKDAPNPFPRSIEAFEEFLKRAHGGKIAAFAVITVDPNGIVNWSWHFGAKPQTDLIGGLECMRWAIVTKAMQPIEQPPIPDPPTNVRQ
jgi:hypothetical protein